MHIKVKNLIFLLSFLILATPLRIKAYKVSIYYPDWKYYKGYSASKIPVEKVDIVNYAFFRIDPATFNLKVIDQYSFKKNYLWLQKLKEKKKNLIITIAVGGYNNSRGFSSLQGQNLNNFISSIKRFIKRYPAFNGVVIDWEYPVCHGGKPKDRDILLNLVKRLKQERLYVAVALSPNIQCQNSLNLKEMAKYVDYFELMGYDLYGQWENKIAPNAPLHWNGLDIEKSVNNLLTKIPANKTLLGVPFYGRSYKGKNLNLGSPFSGKGPGTNEPGVVEYQDIVKNYKNFKYYFDAFSKTPYIENESKTILITYDNRESLKYKLALVKKHKLGGIMIWEITQDYKNQLLDYIIKTLNTRQNTQNNKTSQEKQNPKPTTKTPTQNASNNPVITIQYPQDGDWPNFKDSNYAIEINPWNIQSAQGTITLAYTPAKQNFSLNYDLQNISLRNPGAYVHSYPEIFLGNKPWNTTMVRTDLLPKAFKELKNLYLKASADYKLQNINNIPLNLAFETWLTKEKFRTNGIRSDEVEIMIWFYSNKLNPAGSKISEINIPVTVNNDLKLITFEVYKGYIGWHYIAFRSKQSFKQAQVSFYLNDFLENLPNYLGKDLDGYYIEDLELGTESGSPNTTEVKYKWEIKNFALEITTKDDTSPPTPTPTPTLSPTLPPTVTPTPFPSPTPTPIGIATKFLPNNMTKTSEWGEGFCANIKVYNDTNRLIEWKTKIQKDSNYSITSLWNAEILKTGENELIFKGKDYNKILSPSQKTEFGFCAKYAPLTSQKLTYLQGELKITSDWGTGYCAEVTVKNTYKHGVFWITKIQGANITSLWNANCKMQNKKLTCTGVEWNKYLTPGEKTTFGFCATK